MLATLQDWENFLLNVYVHYVVSLTKYSIGWRNSLVKKFRKIVHLPSGRGHNEQLHFAAFPWEAGTGVSFRFLE